MKFERREPPREFTVGREASIVIRDCGRVDLEPDEQVTFTTPAGGEYDIVRKEWGFYATPSLNGRLAGFGLRPVLVKNPATGRYFLLLVEGGHEGAFDRYLEAEALEVVRWLDTAEALEELV